MSLQFLSATPFVIGLLALAGVLFALQRLRVRHRDLRVPTTLFWREAVERARARTLVERFRHPWAYLLVLLIAALLWTAVAAPRADGDRAVEHLLLIDGSAGMAATDRFARAKAAAVDAARRLPRATTTVRLCGSMPRTLLLPGESIHLLERRLDGAQPEACPSTVERELLALPAGGGRRVQALVIGGRPIDASLRSLLGPHLEAARIGCAADATIGNRGITALAVTEARSGRYDRCDLFVEVCGAEPGAVTIAIDGGASSRHQPIAAVAGGAVYEVFDLPTGGGLLTARLEGSDDLALDDVARLRLPARRLLRVRIAESAGAAPALRQALATDPAIELVDVGADVVVQRAGGSEQTLPTLELSSGAAREHAFFVRDVDATDSVEGLAALLPALGLDAIDAVELAEQAARPISIGGELATRRSVQVEAELLSDRFDFTRSRAFPLFVASAIRWLAGEREWQSWSAVGEPGRRTGAMQDDAGRVHDPLDVRFTPPFAGDFVGLADTVTASVLDPGTTIRDDPSGDVDAELPHAPIDWPVLLALAALLLLVFEWSVYRSGRMP